jgi:hypothetical protein
MGWAVKYDRSLDGAPRDWWHTAIRPPRSVNVDVGRNSLAVIAELRAGIRTHQDVCAELGHNWMNVLEQKAIEEAFINGLVDKYKVTRENISLLGTWTFAEKQADTETAAEVAEDNPDAGASAATETKTESESTDNTQNAQPIVVNVNNNAPKGRRIRMSRDPATGELIAEETIIEEPNNTQCATS